MPKISTFIYSEALEHEMTSQGPRLHVVNPQQIFLPMYVPGMFSFAVTFGVIELDTDIEHDVQFKFIDPNSNIVVDTGSNKTPSVQNVDNLPTDLRGFVMNMDFRNVPLPIEGEYKSEIFLDGEKLDEFPIKVRAKGPQR